MTATNGRPVCREKNGGSVALPSTVSIELKIPKGLESTACQEGRQPAPFGSRLSANRIPPQENLMRSLFGPVLIAVSMAAALPAIAAPTHPNLIVITRVGHAGGGDPAASSAR